MSVEGGQNDEETSITWQHIPPTQEKTETAADTVATRGGVDQSR